MITSPGERAHICNGCVYDARATREGRAAGAEACSFCGRPAAEVERLFASESAAICEGCVDLCLDIMSPED